jgi:rubrerythrin
MKRFAELSEQEILALAISSEEEDNRIYRSFAEALRERYAASAKVFDGMADEESAIAACCLTFIGRSSASTCRSSVVTT